MIDVQGLPIWASPVRLGFEGCDDALPYLPPALPTLIEVPAVRIVSPARRPSPSATERVRRLGSSAASHGTLARRRLRREFRAAGCVLLAAIPFALALLLLLGGVPGPTIAALPESSGAPAGASELSSDAEPFPVRPVRLPGYLLPDDGVEEPAHAGG